MRRPAPLADFVDVCLGPALAAQGFAASDILVAWPDIVGERLASVTQPIRIDWKRRGPNQEPEARTEPASLVVRVESAFALELQHLSPVVIERVNAHYGWRCVGKLVLKQGPVRRPEPKSRPTATIGEADRRRVRAAVELVGEEDLRAALDRLGQAVLGTKPTKA